MLILADLRASHWSVLPGQLDALYPERYAEQVGPAALLVAEGQADLWRAHAWAMAQIGILRRVHTDEAAALAWCAARLKVVSQPKIAR